MKSPKAFDIPDFTFSLMVVEYCPLNSCLNLTLTMPQPLPYRTALNRPIEVDCC